MGTLHGNKYIFMTISFSVLLRKRNVSDSVEENIKTSMLHSIIFSPKNHTFCEIMWENIVEPDRPQMTIWRICIACWIQTHTQNL